MCVCVGGGLVVGMEGGGEVAEGGQMAREGSRGCIKYAWKSEKNISLQIIGVVTEGLKQHCLP